MMPARRTLPAAGFTLIELLVVLAVLGLLLAVASPRFHRALPGMAFETTVDEVAAALHRTRSRAIASGETRVLRVDLERMRLVEPGGRIHELPEGMRIEVTTAAEALEAGRREARLLFFPDGSALGGRVVFEQAGRRAVLQIDWLTGRVSREETV